jgi:hypothetical protein
MQPSRQKRNRLRGDSEGRIAVDIHRENTHDVNRPLSFLLQKLPEPDSSGLQSANQKLESPPGRKSQQGNCFVAVSQKKRPRKRLQNLSPPSATASIRRTEVIHTDPLADDLQKVDVAILQFAALHYVAYSHSTSSTPFTSTLFSPFSPSLRRLQTIPIRPPKSQLHSLPLRQVRQRFNALLHDDTLASPSTPTRWQSVFTDSTGSCPYWRPWCGSQDWLACSATGGPMTCEGTCETRHQVSSTQQLE